MGSRRSGIYVPVSLHGMLAATLLGLQNQPSDWDQTGATIYSGLGATVLVLLVLGAFVYVPVGATVSAAAVVLARRRRSALQLAA